MRLLISLFMLWHFCASHPHVWQGGEAANSVNWVAISGRLFDCSRSAGGMEHNGPRSKRTASATEA